MADPTTEPRLRNSFNKLNGSFMADFVWENNTELLEFIKSDPKWLIRQLQKMNKL